MITGSSGTFELDHHVSLRNAVLKVKEVPLLYLPYMYYPINKDKRSTGFLLPSYGASSTLGQGLTNYFFWVLGRSMDATFYHTLQSKAGQTFATEYQFVSAPGSRGDALFKVIYNKAQHGDDGATVVRPANRSYNIRGGTSQGLPRGFHLLANINYFTSIEDQQRYEQNYYDQSNRQRYFGGTLSGGLGRWYRLSTKIEQTDYYQRGITGATVATRQGRAPQVNVTMTDRPFGRSRVYLGANGEVAYIVQQDNIAVPTTDHSVLRFDASPRVRASLSTLPFLSVSTTGAWRLTHWRESYDPVTRENLPVPISRNVVELRADALGPVFSRVFQPKNNGYAERFKHLIEPRFSIQWISPYRDQAQIVPNDWGVDTLVTGTTNIAYSLTNRLLARRRGVAGAPGTVRDILTVSLSQTRYSNALAAQYDNNYNSAAANSYSPLRVDVRMSASDTLSGAFRTAIDPTFKTPQYLHGRGQLRAADNAGQRLVVENVVHSGVAAVHLARRLALPAGDDDHPAIRRPRERHLFDLLRRQEHRRGAAAPRRVLQRAVLRPHGGLSGRAAPAVHECHSPVRAQVQHLVLARGHRVLLEPLRVVRQ